MSLSSLIQDKKFKFDERVILNVAGKLIRVVISNQALEYLESKSIIHRDIKPENVVFARQNTLDDPVLVDLGFATFEKDYKLLFSRCGTPGHVAPEVLNDKEYNSNADIYSLGIVLYMMITKQNPFENADYDTLIQNNLRGDVKTSVLSQPPHNMSVKGSANLISYGAAFADADCRPHRKTQSFSTSTLV